jgi:hypothetical protein
MENTGFNHINEQISSCVSELLMFHDCVVIPGFGAFIGNYQPSKLHPVTHLVLAPSKQVVFNRNLTKDDGLLAGTYSNKFGMDFSTSRQIIESYVLDLKKAIQVNLRINLKAVGTFSNNPEGIMVFQAEASSNLLSESFGLASVQLSLIVREPIPERRPQPVFVNRDVSVAAPKPIRQWRKIALRSAPVFLLASLLTINSFIPSKNRIHFSDFSFADAYSASPETALKAAPFQALPSIRKAKPVIPDDDLFSAENASIYLVAGCYTSSSNANGMVDYLNDKGFNASILDITPGGLYRVVYGSYADITAASEELTQIKKGFNEEAWMLIK